MNFIQSISYDYGQSENYKKISQTRALEWMFATMMLVWGLSLYLLGAKLPPSAFAALLLLADTEVWAFVSIFMGALRILSLLINGYWKRNPLVRFLGAFWGIIWWSLLGGFYMLAIIKGIIVPFPMMACFFVFVIFEGIAAYRCGKDMHDMGSFKRNEPVNARI